MKIICVSPEIPMLGVASVDPWFTVHQAPTPQPEQRAQQQAAPTNAPPTLSMFDWPDDWKIPLSIERRPCKICSVKFSGIRMRPHCWQCETLDPTAPERPLSAPPAVDGWIEWVCGKNTKCPIPDDVRFEVKIRGGGIFQDDSKEFDGDGRREIWWRLLTSGRTHSADVVAYRIKQ